MLGQYQDTIYDTIKHLGRKFHHCIVEWSLYGSKIIVFGFSNSHPLNVFDLTKNCNKPNYEEFEQYLEVAEGL